MSEKADLQYYARVEYQITDKEQKTYNFPFPYLKKEFVHVAFIDAHRIETDLTYGVDYTVDELTITLTGITPVPDDNSLVIYRDTSTTRIVSWSDASILLSKDMTLEQVQTLHLIEEAKDYIIQNLKATQDVEYYSTLAKTWAQSAASPDGDTDTESPTGKTQSSKSWALYSKERAQLSKQFSEEADNSAQEALQSASSASSSSYEAARAAAQAEQSAQTTLPDAYDSSKTYSFPDVVVYQDGNTYRCIGTEVTGEDPRTSNNWVLVSTVYGDFFDLDSDGALMPALNPIYSHDFEIDDDGNIMPKE